MNKSRVIICIHGFGAFCSNEFEPLLTYMNKMDPDYDFVSFDLYDANDTKPSYKKWVKRAMNTIELYSKLYDEVNLLGFSMGGMIATHCATKLPYINKVILVAPAFRLINYSTLHQIIRPNHTKESYPITVKTKLFKNSHVFPLYFKEFVKCIGTLRPAVRKMDKDVIIFHSPQDEYVAYEGSLAGIKRLRGKHRTLVTCEGGAHELLIHPEFMESIGKEIDLFMKIQYNQEEK